MEENASRPEPSTDEEQPPDLRPLVSFLREPWVRRREDLKELRAAVKRLESYNDCRNRGSDFGRARECLEAFRRWLKDDLVAVREGVKRQLRTAGFQRDPKAPGGWRRQGRRGPPASLRRELVVYFLRERFPSWERGERLPPSDKPRELRALLHAELALVGLFRANEIDPKRKGPLSYELDALTRPDRRR